MFASSTCTQAHGSPATCAAEDIGDRHRQRVEVVVVLVEQRAREHVGAGERELERPAGDAGGARAIAEQVQRAFRERPVDHGGGLAPELHLARARGSLPVGAAHALATPPNLLQTKYSIIPLVSG